MILNKLQRVWLHPTAAFIEIEVVQGCRYSISAVLCFSSFEWYHSNITSLCWFSLVNTLWLTFGVTCAAFCLFYFCCCCCCCCFVVVFVLLLLFYLFVCLFVCLLCVCVFLWVFFFFFYHKIPKTKHKYISFIFFQVWHCLHLGNWLSENVARNNRLKEDTDKGTTCAVQQTGR